MPLGNAQVGYDAFSPFTVTLTRETSEGLLNASVQIKFNADGYTSETVLATFQELLDFLSTSPDFGIVQAQRNAFGYQEITPTA